MAIPFKKGQPSHEKRLEELDARLADIASRVKLDAPNAFTEAVSCPAELYAGLQANRPELIRVAPARPLTADETKAVYSLIATLIETNAALREHAEQVSQLVENWGSHFKGLERTGNQIRQFAAFKPLIAADPEGEEDDQ
jgi:hypothetical protein